jgi:PAS domain S-box-containing protein
MNKKDHASFMIGHRFLSGEGGMAQLIRSFDWSSTSLGSISGWPQSLLTALNICLNSRQPALLYWGKDMIRLYNDEYAAMMGKKHPRLLGSKGGEGFPEVWEKIGHLIEESYKTAIPGSLEDQMFRINRHGNDEECYFSVSFSPVFNELGETGGVYMSIVETTHKVISGKKIMESEARLRLAVESTKLGTWEYDPVSGDLNWSDECRAIFAFPADKKVDFQIFSDHIHPDDKENTLAEISKAMSDTGSGNYDITYRILKYDDKSPRWIRATGKVYFDKEGRASRFIGTVLDVTEQKKFISGLEESEKRFKAVADTAPAMIWTSGPDKVFDFFNSGWLEFTGKKNNDETGNGWMNGIHPEDIERYLDIYNTSFEARKKFSMEYRLKRHDGKYRWISDEGAPRYSSEGEFLGYIGAALDVQERKMAREELERKVLERTSELNKRNNELKEQKEFVDTILESSVDVIAVLDKDLRYVTLNSSACALYKVKKEELIGKRIIDVYPLIKLSGMYDDLKEALKGTTIHNPKYRSTVLDKHFENFYIPLKDRKGLVYGVLLLSHDNTAIIETTEKLKQTNRALEEKNLELERSNKELESFSYVASHDLQEPLRKIRTFAELVRNNLHDEKTVKKYFNKIESSAQRMGDLIKAVLNYSRLSRTEELFAETDLNVILKNVRSDFELLIEEKGAVIKSNKLPAIKGIPLQLNQLFSNLIGNSIKFTESKPRISISAKVISAENMPVHPHIQRNTKYAKIVFKDNGIGFDPQYADQIFTIFKRLHGHDSYAGTGIGLALCKKIVENHKGFIAVQSEPGKGSEFYIYLPVNK